MTEFTHKEYGIAVEIRREDVTPQTVGAYLELMKLMGLKERQRNSPLDRIVVLELD